MEAETKVKLLSLNPYRHLFPKAALKDHLIKRGARVSDTVHLIPEGVRQTRWQAKEFVEQELSGLSPYEACEKLWYFIKYHVKYEPDKKGLEMVRSFRRLMHDGEGDCDCFTTSIDTALSWVKGIKKIYNRITDYGYGFQHIYPIAILENGTRIIMDCVTDRFNYEKPYTKKEDYEMDLQFLDGIEEREIVSGNVDAQAVLGYGGMGEIGKLFKKHASSEIPGNNQGGKKKKGFQKFKEGVKKTMNVLNKANPGTGVLRAGILASMKTNIMKVAENLKWAYLTEEEAKKRGADMSKFSKLKKVLTKIEGIFYTAGGAPHNLKKAIITGHGNRHHEVNGLGLLEFSSYEMQPINADASLQELLGDIYHDEFVNGLEGEGLGVIATSAAIASATTIMGTIAALIKSIGGIFPKKKGEGGGGDSNGGGDSSGGGEEGGEPTVSTSSEGGGSETPTTTEKSLKKSTTTDDEGGGGDNGDTNGTNGNGDDAEATGIKAFYDKNKKWVKPVGITVVAAAVLYTGYRIMKAQKEKKSKPIKTEERRTEQSGQIALAGYSRHGHKKKKKKKKGTGKKQHVALM